MRWFRIYVVGIVGSIVVLIPLLYLNVVVGRQGRGHSDIGWSTYIQLYGWPRVHGWRVISEPWFPTLGTKEIGPLEGFSMHAVAVNAAVAVAMLVSSFYGSERIRSMLHDRQFSLANALTVCAVFGGVCAFTRYDRSGGIPYSVNVDMGTMEFAILQGAPSITDSPAWVSALALIGVAATIYTILAAATRIGTALWHLSRRSNACNS